MPTKQKTQRAPENSNAPAAPDSPRDRLRRPVHRRHPRPRPPHVGPGARRRPYRRQHGARLLGTDDHPCHPRRPRGDAPGGRGRGRGGRRHRAAHQGHHGHLAGHRFGQRPHDERPLPGRPLRGGQMPRMWHALSAHCGQGHRPERGALRQLRRRCRALYLHQRLHHRLRRQPHRGRHPGQEGRRADRP